MRKLVQQAEEGRLSAERTPTVAQWMDRWLADVASSTVRPTTLSRYEQEVRLHVKPALGRIRLDALRPHHIADLYKAKRSELSPTSIRRLHAMLRRSLTIAVRWGLISINPAQMVDPPAMTRTKIHPFSREEAEQFRIAAAKDRLAARWLIGLLLGLRQGEVLGLTWDDVDLDGQSMAVNHALQKIDNEFTLVAPKTKRSARVLPIPTVVLESLKRRRSDQLADADLAAQLWQGNELDLLFTTHVGTPIERSNDYRAFQALLKRAGLRKIRLHDLRHTAASLMLEQGIPARVVMELLGHSQISLTLDTYTHVDKRLLKDASVLIERLTGGD
ncbi:tyrosine-type recombinase/integrase [Mumia sp. Pv 4-285]|uniref:tyrosine-type recombinase/integrase n=1 Tax=Mumia qirimensis TaxID=3234852 RepID=UPI00351DA7FD